MATNCWELRGCYKDVEMCENCIHNIPGEPCPLDCKFSMCFRPTHVVCQDILKILNPELNYDAAIKEVCRVCEHFLEHGPSVSEGLDPKHRQGNPNRFLL